VTRRATAANRLDRTGQITPYAGCMERVLTARGTATRQRIVEAAAALIRERGVADTGLDDIGAATATSKSQMFHYFPRGKADLLHAVAVHEAEQVIADQQPYIGDLTSWRRADDAGHRPHQLPRDRAGRDARRDAPAPVDAQGQTAGQSTSSQSGSRAVLTARLGRSMRSLNRR
jgi:hypothetical protein